MVTTSFGHGDILVWFVEIFFFVVWFWLIVRYSANRLSAFSFLTPLFGVAAGHLVLNEPLTPAFAGAVESKSQGTDGALPFQSAPAWNWSDAVHR